MCYAISRGSCEIDLSNRSPGCMNHARWLTTANRILRLYVATSEPWQELRDVVRFILKSYAPTWFKIKRSPSCIKGSLHLFKAIQSCNYLKGKQREVVQKCMQHNAFYAHPENVILGMLFDENEFARNKAIQLLEKCTPLGSNLSSDLRKFEIPKINFNAKTYYGMINFNLVNVSYPPLLANVSKDALKDLYKSDLGKRIAQIPCHSQAVERNVKLVTEAAASVTEKHRHGLILNTISSRAKMPKFSSKKNFNTE